MAQGPHEFITSRVTLPRIAGIGFVLTAYVVVQGMTWFQGSFDLSASDYTTNLWTEFAGVLAGGVVVAFIFDGVAELHQRRRWRGVRSGIYGALRYHFYLRVREIVPDDRWESFDYEGELLPPMAQRYAEESEWLSDKAYLLVNDLTVPPDERELDAESVDQLRACVTTAQTVVPHLLGHCQRALDHVIYAQGEPGLIARLIKLEEFCRSFVLAERVWQVKVYLLSAIFLQISVVAKEVEKQPEEVPGVL